MIDKFSSSGSTESVYVTSRSTFITYSITSSMSQSSLVPQKFNDRCWPREYVGISILLWQEDQEKVLYQHTQPSRTFAWSLRIRMSILSSEGSKLSIGHGNVVPVMAVRGTRSPETYGGGHTVGGCLF